jgi:hypothetical protein
LSWPLEEKYEKWMILKEMDECGVASWEQMAEMEER